MEYHRAYWEEYPNSHLVARHEREIFPLFHRRGQFAEVDSFLLYDFYTPHGQVDENVFAYSNRTGAEASLVIYHNRWADTRGWIKTSAAFRDKAKDQLLQTNLGEGLGLKNQEITFTIFRDQISGLEFIRSNRDINENGLYVELGAYKYHVFVDFREVDDNEWRQYAQLNEYLKGRGVPDMEEAMQEILLQPLHYPFRELVNADMFRMLQDSKSASLQVILDEVEQKMIRLLSKIEEMIDAEAKADKDILVEEVCRKLESALGLALLPKQLPASKGVNLNSVLAWLDPSEEDTLFWGAIFGWLFTHNLGKAAGEEEFAERGRSWLDDWLLGKIIRQTLEYLELAEEETQDAVTGIKAMVAQQSWGQAFPSKPDQAAQILQTWLRDDDIQRLLRINRYQGILWFNKEAFDQLLRWMLAIAIIATNADPDLTEKKKAKNIQAHYDLIVKLEGAAVESGYQVEKLLDGVK